MSRHEGVSCDSCLKGNFRGRRFKCLICYDYDLCATCYESGATTARHTTEHPMQCILTRTDFDLFYGSEALSVDQPQSFTCPYCSRMGLTEAVLLDHIISEHADSSAEVVCPICAALPSGDPNYVTDDFAAHLTLEHRAPSQLEPIGSIRHVRRIPHPGRGVGGSRTRRANMHFQSSGSTLSGINPNSRETMDPIAELLSQLSSVRSRAAAAQSVSSQLQQLEMQLQTTRQQLERLPRRCGVETSRATANGNQAPVAMLDFAAAISGGNNNTGASSASSNANSQFLLARYGEQDLSESERQVAEVERADRSLFVQELLLSSLAEGLRLDSEEEDASDTETESLDFLNSQLKLDSRPPEGRGGVELDRRDERSAAASPGLPNGPTNDVIIHAPTQRDRVTSGHGTNGNMVKRSKEPSSERNNKSVGTGAVTRGSNTPPPKNSH